GRKQTGDSYHGLQLRQEIYTPKDLSADTIAAGDHPYSSTLTLSQVKITDNAELGIRYISELRLGILGPAALGFHAQKLIHNITPSDPPQGWDNQVGNDLMLNYNVTVDKGVVEDEYSQFILHGRARLGTVYTDATAGFLVRMEYQPKYFSFIDPDPARRFNIYVEFGGNLRFVGYDASLQGGMFNRTSPYTIPSESVSRIVAEGRINIVLELPKHQLVFYENVVSPRFDASEWHAWLGISYRYWW
ncbi:hypothetical protein LCGC14_3118520, partial [marine sediment metagenome]